MSSDTDRRQALAVILLLTPVAISLILFVLNALSIIAMSGWWIALPILSTYGLLFVIGEASIVRKYIRNKYWK